MNKYIKALIILLLINTVTYGQYLETGIDEHLNQTIPGYLIFKNENNIDVNLKQLVNKPTVISLVYFECPGLCTPLLNGIAEVIDRADMQLGKEYQVITISFNPNDKPALAKAKKKNYVNQIQKVIDPSNWMWLTGDSATIVKITQTLGFLYKKEGKDYTHPAAIIVLSPEGKITRYLHGTYFLPFDLKMAVTEASQGKAAPTINKMLKFCFSYDPAGRRYVFNITKITGAIVLICALGLFFFYFLRKSRKI